jgi:hypothetical protein
MVLDMDNARRIVANEAKLPELMHKERHDAAPEGGGHHRKVTSV